MTRALDPFTYPFRGAHRGNAAVAGVGILFATCLLPVDLGIAGSGVVAAPTPSTVENP